MARAHNFNAGPAGLPLPALERAQRELIDFEGTGMSIMEHSHRGKAYEAVHNEAIALTRELLSVPDDYDVLFLQGGASLQFAQVPMNFLHAGKSADYIAATARHSDMNRAEPGDAEAHTADACTPSGPEADADPCHPVSGADDDAQDDMGPTSAVCPPAWG